MYEGADSLTAILALVIGEFAISGGNICSFLELFKF